MQITSFVVEEPMPSQLHAEDEQAEQLGESSAEDVVTEVQLKPILEVVNGIVHESAIFMQTDGFVVYLKERGMVDCGSRNQAEKLHGLNSQETDDAPDDSRWQVADGD